MPRRQAEATAAPRVRRDPEETRGLILDASDRLFAVRGPDAVGLKDVAREAGVSHALVSHYFGTYAGLVDAVLERRARRMRERVVTMLAEATEASPRALLESLWDVLTDRSAARVTAWAVLSGKAEEAEFFPRRVQGLKLVVDAIMGRLPPAQRDIAREDVEFLATLAVAATLGHALVGPTLRIALGKRPSAASGVDFRARLSQMFEAYLAGAGRRG